MSVRGVSARAPDGRRLIDAALFVTIDDPTTRTAELRLAGSRCVACGAVAFPAQGSCPRCTGQECTSHALSTTGTIWASTVQRFTPKTPYLDAAGAGGTFGVGYVDLGGEVLVESRLIGAPEELGIGSAVELTLESLPGDDGEPVWTFAFRPATDTDEEDR